MDLSAPTSGPNKGVLLFQDRNAPTTLINKVVGNADHEDERHHLHADDTARL